VLDENSEFGRFCNTAEQPVIPNKKQLDKQEPLSQNIKQRITLKVES